LGSVWRRAFAWVAEEELDAVNFPKQQTESQGGTSSNAASGSLAYLLDNIFETFLVVNLSREIFLARWPLEKWRNSNYIE
jgi:hypothetical protein